MPAQAGARYIKNERISAAAVEEGWVSLWRQVDPLPVESKVELQSLIESYLRRNKPKPAAPPSGVVNGRSSSTTDTVSLMEAVQPALLQRVERYFETTRSKTCEIYRAAWRRFCSWCEDAGHTPLPCTSEVLLQYLSALDHRGLSRDAIAQTVSAVGRVYRIAGLPSPLSHEARAMVNPALEQRDPSTARLSAMGPEGEEGREPTTQCSESRTSPDSPAK